MKKKLKTMFDDKSLKFVEMCFNILLQKPQQAPGANISSLVKFESLI